MALLALARGINANPANTACAWDCELKPIGQDIAERLDYEPGVFTVECPNVTMRACRH